VVNLKLPNRISTILRARIVVRGDKRHFRWIVQTKQEVKVRVEAAKEILTGMRALRNPPVTPELLRVQKSGAASGQIQRMASANLRGGRTVALKNKKVAACCSREGTEAGRSLKSVTELSTVCKNSHKREFSTCPGTTMRVQKTWLSMKQFAGGSEHRKPAQLRMSQRTVARSASPLTETDLSIYFRECTTRLCVVCAIGKIAFQAACLGLKVFAQGQRLRQLMQKRLLLVEANTD